MVFEIGDVVYLKNNPKHLMTVSLNIDYSLEFVTKRLKKRWQQIGLCSGDVQCAWFNESKLEFAYFKTNILNKKDVKVISGLKYEAGDVVYLKSNPKRLMTVSYIFGEVETTGYFEKHNEKQFRKFGYIDGDVQCAWFDGAEYTLNFFRAQMLNKTDSGNIRPILEEEDVVFLKSNPERLLSVSIVLGKTKLSGFREKRSVKNLPNFGFVDGDVQCWWFNNRESELAFIRAQMLGKKFVE